MSIDKHNTKEEVSKFDGTQDTADKRKEFVMPVSRNRCTASIRILLFKCDLLASLFIGSEGSCGQQGTPFSLMV